MTMKKILFGLLTMLSALVCMGADSSIHGLATRATPGTNDMFVIDYQSGGAWYNAKMPLISLQEYIGGSVGAPVTYVYTTNL